MLPNLKKSGDDIYIEALKEIFDWLLGHKIILSLFIFIFFAVAILAWFI